MSSASPSRSSKQSLIKKTLFGFTSFALLVATSLLIGGTATAADDAVAESIWQAITEGKPTLNFRFRTEMANEADRPNAVPDRNTSWAMTARTRLGYGTKPYRGVSVFAEMENTAPIAKQLYNSLTPQNNDPSLTPIADPKATGSSASMVNIAFD